MAEPHGGLEELERRLASYENFKRVLQQYLERLLASDQDTLALVAEMLETVKAISGERVAAEPPADIHRILSLREEALLAYGGVAHVEDVPAPDPLKGGTIKIDDPRVYGLSLVCTWLDCIVSNPEQSLDSLRKVFLRTTDPWGIELSRTFFVDVGRLEPIADGDAWLDALLDGSEQLSAARVTNIAQLLGLEPLEPLPPLPVRVWRHLLRTRRAYEITPQAAGPYLPQGARVVTIRNEPPRKEGVFGYALGRTLRTEQAPLLRATSFDDLQKDLLCSLATPVRLERIERGEQLAGQELPQYTATLPFGALRRALILMLNHPPDILLHDVTPPQTSRGHILRVASASEPSRRVRLVRLSVPPEEEWPSRHGWHRTYTFFNLGRIGVPTAPPGSYLRIDLREGGTPEAQLYFHAWGSQRLSLRLTTESLQRAAQTGSLILLGCDEETALEALSCLQGLIGPAAQEIEPVVSHLDCQVRWRPQQAPELFAED
ncbi:MAG: hypothetical protein ACP5SI_02575 [Chloroflexia bacterium]